MISKHRLELFSDAVIAIVITVMLLELHPPEHAGWTVWLHEVPMILAYLMGFIMVSFSWIVHHQVFERTRFISGPMVAANFAFLFFLSLMPIMIRVIAEHPHDTAPVLQTVLLGWVQMQMMTLFRLLGRKQHWSEPGYQEWHRKRNRMSLLGLVQIGTILLVAVWLPVVADILLVGVSLFTVIFYMGTSKEDRAEEAV